MLGSSQITLISSGEGSDPATANGTLGAYTVGASIGAGGENFLAFDLTNRALAAPTLSAALGDNEINLSWTQIDGSVSYNLYRSTTSGSGYTLLNSGIAGTNYSDTALGYETSYYYVVTAVDASGNESAIRRRRLFQQKRRAA